MEHFRNAKVVRLLSRHNKYLTADDDDEDGVRQHRSGASRGAKWEVELVEGRTDAIRLKSCFNRYLAASDKRFLLGATGKRIVLLPLPPKAQPQSLGKSVEWQPVRDGTKFVKLQTKAGTFLRANGFIKPYGNTVTHGNPHRTATQEWVFWEVDVVEMAPNSKTDPPPPSASDLVTQPYPCSTGAITPARKTDQHPAPGGVWTGKVLADLASVSGAHSRRSSSGVSDVSASSCISQDEGDNSTPSPRSSAVSAPSSRSSAVESGARPTRFRTSSIERDPVTAALQSSADTISTVSSTPASTPVTLTSPRRKIHSPPLSPPRKPSTPTSPPPRKTSTPVSSPPRRMPTHSSPPRMPVLGSQYYSSWKEVAGVGRLIQYYFADDDGGVDDSFDSGAFEFHGVTVQELLHKVEEETDLDGFILCTRNVVNGRLCRLKLDVPLPPNRAPMTVFIVHPMSNVGKDIFLREAQSM